MLLRNHFIPTKSNFYETLLLSLTLITEKTTTVDRLLQYTGAFRQNQEMRDCVMDNNDLERERGITILAKNTAIAYKEFKINVIDTPGHADFGGEVERVLKMADGVLLIVDAFEGPKPQTRFVLKKALSYQLKPIVVINKIDRPDQRANVVLDLVFDLFVELNANDEQLEFPVIYASSRQGIAKRDMQDEDGDMSIVLDSIIEHIPCPVDHSALPLQMQIMAIDYNDFLGRIGIGRVFSGSIRQGMTVAVMKEENHKNERIKELFVFRNLERSKVNQVYCGDIAAIAGIEGIDIGDTISDPENPKAMERVIIDDPTISMLFIANDSPFRGQEGEYVTSRQLRDRLQKELLSNVALRIEETDSPDAFKVSGRGVLHLSVLIETMRREGFEFQVSKPEVITKTVDGKLYEPIEISEIDVPEEYQGKIIELMGKRRGELLSMDPSTRGRTNLRISIPSRGLIGIRTKLLNLSCGEAVMYSTFSEFGAYRGPIPSRNNGVLVSHLDGEAVNYAMGGLVDRGFFIIEPGDKVYEGMVVGEHCKDNDLVVNVCKKKQLTNFRNTGSDKAVKLPPKTLMMLEEALEYINEDELVEITPLCFRIRKRYLKEKDRKRAGEK
jgi:GTP-binding protein